MNAKRLILSIFLCLTLLAAGCETFTASGKAGKAEKKGRAEIVQIDDRQEANVAKKIDTIGEFSFGIEYDLRKLTNPPVEVEVALDLNSRILTLSGNPNLERMKEMRELVDKLTSDLEKEKIQGRKMLDSKDVEIVAIQTESKALVEAKDAAIDKYMSAAATAAAQADGYKDQIDDLNSYWGLGAIFYGIKRFVIRFAWMLAIGSILFIVLRFAAQSNPIAAGLFSVFEIGVSWFVHCLKALAPKAVELAGHVTKSTFNAHKSAMSKIIDSIQIVKERATAAGKPPTLDDALIEVGKNLDASEKALIDEIKTELKWK